ncbi:MAG TPA: hypothetical protein DEB25_00955 [Desulfobulbaceae bacterium]|nr:hypothetical protein [Desulfobulbaceae bacterium]
MIMTLALAGPAIAGENRLGLGTNYWVALDDIDSDVDDNGFSWLLSYQHHAGLFTIELDGELLPDRFGETAVAPQAYLLIGGTIYAGAGIGIVYSDSSFADEPFFALRAGLDLEILPGLHLDISGNYRFNDSADLSDSAKDIDTDTIFLGATARIEF